MEADAEEKDRGLWKRLAFELIVVFAGVYGAWMLSDYQERQREKRDRRMYHEAFLEEMRRYDAVTHQQRDLVDSLIQFYDREIRAGRTPELKIHRALDFTSNFYVTKAAFQNAYMNSIGIDQAVSISLGSNLISLLEKRIDAYHAECRRFFYGPNVEQRKFYDEKGRLIPSMQWYLEDLESIRGVFDVLIMAIEKGAIPSTEKLIQAKE